MNTVTDRNKALLLASKREEEITVERKRLTDYWHTEVKRYFESNGFDCKREVVTNCTFKKLYLGEQTTASYADHPQFSLFTPDPFTGFGQVATTQGIWAFELINPKGESVDLSLRLEVGTDTHSLKKIMSVLQKSIPFPLLEYAFKYYKYDRNKSWRGQQERFEIAENIGQLIERILVAS